MNYTRAERTVKKYTVGNVLSNAKKLLGNIPICTNAVSRLSENDLLTLEELNHYVQQVVSDSRFYHL